MDDYRVELPEFHGPLDLLLYLVKRDEVDILDIPIARVADQFLAWLHLLKTIDVEVAGEFLVTAATLMEIKSKMLLPGLTEPAAEAAVGDDPRDELVKQLLEYKKYKDAAACLEGRAAARERQLPRGHEPARPAAGKAPVQAVELWDVVGAFGRLMQEAAAFEPNDVVSDETPQHIYREEVLERLRAAGRLALSELLTPPYRRMRLIGLFLAILELIRERSLTLEQPEPFGEIWLVFGEPPSSM